MIDISPSNIFLENAFHKKVFNKIGRPFSAATGMNESSTDLGYLMKNTFENTFLINLDITKYLQERCNMGFVMIYLL